VPGAAGAVLVAGPGVTTTPAVTDETESVHGIVTVRR